MKSLWMPLGACFLVCGALFGAETLREFSWSELKGQGRLRSGMVVRRGEQSPFEILMLENRDGGPLEVGVLSIENPGVTAEVWALKGRVRYEGVEGNGYVEMWNFFADGGRYFSRTLAPQGPMASLHGSSGWRDLVVPFYATGTDKRPSRIVVNVAFPGKGTVWLGPLAIWQYAAGEDPLIASGAWWTDRQGGIIGGVAGSLLGIAGALIGLLCSLGRARPVVLGMMWAAVLIGMAAVSIGLYALLRGQPYGVYYPLLLGGGLSCIVFGALITPVRRRYAAIELRRIDALDMA